VEDEEEDPLLLQRKGKGKEKADAEPPSSQSTDSSDTGPQTPEDEEFDLAAVPKQPLPKVPIRRRASSIKSNTSKTKAKPKVKPKAPATAYQISATLAPKPKPKARKKRTQSADGVIKTSHKAGMGKSKTKRSTSDSAAPKIAKPITIAPRGATIVNRVAPKTFAALDS
jgi:hypothetical protein